MAVSAYDAAGRLKKNPLLGTSFASDPTRALEREQYMGLHSEAKGRTREEMEGLLTSRFQAYGRPQMTKLEELAEQEAGIQQEYAGLRDPEEELGFQKQIQKAGKFLAPYDQSQYRTKTGKLKTGAIYKTLPTSEKQGIKQAWKLLSGKEKQSYKKTAKGKKGGGIASFAQAEFMRQQRAAQKARSDYTDRINEEIDQLNERYIPIQQDIASRESKLADRVDFYNMFLGV
jgi:hypothetical protein